MKEWLLQVEGDYLNVFEDRSEHGSYEEAEKAAGELYDSGDTGDFRIVEKATGSKWRLSGHTFEKQPCPICRKDVRRRNMFLTSDCHGIAFRYVCEDCYDKIMASKGYDGEKYDETDENLEYDY